MVRTVLFLVALILIIAALWLVPVLKKTQRRDRQNRPLPVAWVKILQQKVPFYQKLPESWQKRLHGHINVFLAEKQFIGCGGLRITEEMRVIIAAYACLLLLNERGEYYPKLVSILVYPSAYVANQSTPMGGLVVEERKVVRLGESWASDQVVLAWEQIERDCQNWRDGRNVILHEFAHQLDQEDGRADGVPILEQNSDYRRWAEIFSREYQKLQSQVERGSKTVIDQYGAINPAEFFAVATETFWEKPQQMAKKHPKLYAELRRYYKLDPLEWF